jgi:hypothetical protein
MADRARRHERKLRAEWGVIQLAERLEPTVRRGPFAGLSYPQDRLADVDAPVAKLLGSYEQELHGIFAAALARGTETFIDIGCADGYYAVGMALASTQTTVWAWDISRSSRRLCHEVAQLNGCVGGVRIGNRFSASSLDQIPTSGALLLCDIEGAERELITAELASRLTETHVVIEAHEHAVPGIQAHLRELFAESHACRTIPQAPRDPDFYPEISLWTAEERESAVNERRGAPATWLDFTPVGRSPDPQAQELPPEAL